MGDQYQIAARALDEAIGWRATSWHNLSDLRHLIEVGWQAASTPGGSDGNLDLWIDGVLEQTLSGVENEDYWIDDGWLGPSYGIDNGTRGDLLPGCLRVIAAIRDRILNLTSHMLQ